MKFIIQFIFIEWSSYYHIFIVIFPILVFSLALILVKKRHPQVW